MKARMADLARRASRGEVALSDFLSPHDRLCAMSELRALGAAALAYGGYEGAQRQKIYVLPDYMEGAESADALSDFGAQLGISALRITPGGFSRALTHRDFLGAVLNTGLDRAVLGDILVDEQGSATLFCNSAIESFILFELSRVANEKVNVCSLPLADVVVPEQRFEDINDTLASPRLDCVIGALCRLSRDKAKTAVISGLVELDFFSESRPERAVCEGAVISVRGFGRYRIVSLSDKTRKGRYRLFAQKYL